MKHVRPRLFWAAAMLVLIAALSFFTMGFAFPYKSAVPQIPPARQQEAAETLPVPSGTISEPEQDEGKITPGQAETGEDAKPGQPEDGESLVAVPPEAGGKREPGKQEEGLPDKKEANPTGNTGSPAGARYLPVLVYHHLAPESLGLHHNNPMYLPVELFRKHMEYLKKHNYYTPTLAEVEAFLAGRGEMPEKSVLITFDDGYESNYHYAHPVLSELGLRAVNFVIGGQIGQDDPAHLFDPAVSTHLSFSQMAEMVESGTWEIGSHTHDGHVKINGVPALLAWDTGQITDDFLKINETLAAGGLPRPMAVAYPYGGHDEKAQSASPQAGYRLGFTVEEGYAKPGTDPLLVPRFGVFPWTSVEKIASILQKASQ